MIPNDSGSLLSRINPEYFLIILSSCGIKKSWDESGKYTINKDLASNYIWKKVHMVKMKSRKLCEKWLQL